MALSSRRRLVRDVRVSPHDERRLEMARWKVQKLRAFRKHGAHPPAGLDVRIEQREQELRTLERELLGVQCTLGL